MSLVDGYFEVPRGKIAAVVTSLEMLERPLRRPTAANPSWQLQHFTHPDVQWYRDLQRQLGSEWLWFSRLSMSDNALEAIIHNPLVEVRTLQIERQNQGILELDFRKEEECELSFLGLTNSMIGKGAGRWLMNHAIECAWSKRIRRFWVHTCTLDHPSALAFYIRSEFKPFQRHIEITDDPRISGLFPRTAAPHIPIL